MKTIVDDNKCKFCTRFANWANKTNPVLNILPIREKEAKSILRNFGIKFIDLQTVYFVNETEILVRSKAIFKICRYCNYPWKLISIFRICPTKLTDYFYKLFAKYRYYF